MGRELTELSACRCACCRTIRLPRIQRQDSAKTRQRVFLSSTVNISKHASDRRDLIATLELFDIIHDVTVSPL